MTKLRSPRFDLTWPLLIYWVNKSSARSSKGRNHSGNSGVDRPHGAVCTQHLGLTLLWEERPLGRRRDPSFIHFIHSLNLCGVPSDCEGPCGEHGEDTVLAFLSLTGFRETIKKGRLPRGSTRVVGTHEVTELVLEQSQKGL